MPKRKRKTASTGSADKSRGLTTKNRGDSVSGKPGGHSDRHNRIAMVLASLVAGLLLVIATDRVTHVGGEFPAGSSRHGWPWIYLERDLIEPPLIFVSGNTYSWPYPPVKNELREFVPSALVFDLAVIGVIALTSYRVINFLVLRYDRWRT